MRPPLNAGENGARASRTAHRARSFNEAPAERGGELALGGSSLGVMTKLQ